MSATGFRKTHLTMTGHAPEPDQKKAVIAVIAVLALFFILSVAGHIAFVAGAGH